MFLRPSCLPIRRMGSGASGGLWFLSETGSRLTACFVFSSGLLSREGEVCTKDPHSGNWGLVYVCNKAMATLAGTAEALAMGEPNPTPRAQTSLRAMVLG